MKKLFWTKEHCIEEINKYDILKNFIKNSRGAYLAAIKHGWIDEICKHIIKRKSKGYWNKENCQNEALKYKTKTEFINNSVGAYNSALKYGWLNEICSHMICIGNKYKRCIYALEFSNNVVYIGLTHDCDDRFKQHINQKKCTVYKYIKETKLIPLLKQLTDYIDVQEASKEEEVYRNKYENNHWTILNKAKCGSIGGCKCLFLKYSKEDCKKQALKYDTKIKFLNGSPGEYRTAVRNNFINEICIHMIKTKKPKKFWTKTQCNIESKKYKNRSEFKKNSSYPYNLSLKKGWIDDICIHMKYKNL